MFCNFGFYESSIVKKNCDKLGGKKIILGERNEYGKLKESRFDRALQILVIYYFIMGIEIIFN
jgi:hypothetical protein